MAEKLGVLMGLLALQVATVSDSSAYLQDPPTPVGLCHPSLMEWHVPGFSVAVTTCAWSDCRLLWYVPGLIYYSLLWHVSGYYCSLIWYVPGFIVACYGMCLVLFIIACYGVCLVLL